MNPPPATALRLADSPAAQPKRGSDWIAPDCRGLNFYRIDRAFQDLLALHLAPEVLAHFTPHFDRMGELAGNRLDELAATADKHGPVLHARDRYGRDEDWIDYHPAYREMERIAFAEFGLHAMSHRGGVLGWPEPAPLLVKYAFQYLFVQAEFGLMCPISVTDTSTFLIARYGDESVKRRFFDRMVSQDMETLLKGTQFMTEKAGGSDVGAAELRAVREGDHWRLYGDKWFCSHADADVALILARPEGAPAGTRGLGLFAMPRRLDDGSRNSYRIVRLKDKLGTKSMASGEIVLDGAVAYAVGDVTRGLKQMMDQVNLSRLSHGVRAASMMRRCLNESLVVARNRSAFGRTIVDFPLLRRQLMKILVPTEQALSGFVWATSAMGAAQKGDAAAEKLLRILTPLLKFRACRDNVKVATGAMEVRGGNGYIEDWINPRLVRDAHIGVLWEGTSNINGLDVITRAVAKEQAHMALHAALQEKLADATNLPVPEPFRTRLGGLLDRAVGFAEEVAATPENETLCRAAASALYHATTAVLLAWEGSEIGGRGGDARRLLIARMVADHRLSPRDPLAAGDEGWEAEATDLLLSDDPVPLARAAALVG